VNGLKAAWHRWERMTAKLDNPSGRIVVTLIVVGLWSRFPWAWKFLVPAYMLLLGKFAFGIISRTILAVIYIVIMTPVGLIVRISDPLRIRRRRCDTYWIARPAADESLEVARRQG
jgi:hypothetical protein